MRLEKVPGGLRLASWLGGQLEREAPVLELDDLPALITTAAEKELFAAAEKEKLGSVFDSSENGFDRSQESANGTSAQPYGRSPGRAGELKDELRVEPLDDGQLRIARWVMRPNRGWELQNAPVLLPPGRFAQALADAAKRGLLVAGQPTT